MARRHALWCTCARIATDFGWHVLGSILGGGWLIHEFKIASSLGETIEMERLMRDEGGCAGFSRDEGDCACFLRRLHVQREREIRRERERERFGERERDCACLSDVLIDIRHWVELDDFLVMLLHLLSASFRSVLRHIGHAKILCDAFSVRFTHLTRDWNHYS